MQVYLYEVTCKMKKIPTIIFLLMCFSTTQAQFTSLERNSDFLKNYNRSHGYSLEGGYDIWEKLRLQAYYTFYTKTAFEKHHAGGQAGYVHRFDILPINLSGGIGMQQHFGGSYPKHLIRTPVTGNPYQCFTDQAQSRYFYLSLEYRRKQWSLPLEYRYGQYTVKGQLLPNYSCSYDMRVPPNLTESQYQSISVGVRYYFKDLD